MFQTPQLRGCNISVKAHFFVNRKKCSYKIALVNLSQRIPECNIANLFYQSEINDKNHKKKFLPSISPWPPHVSRRSTKEIPLKCLPILSADAIPRTTAIGCFKQNSCSCGLNACFLFSKCTDGVGGSNCSRSNRCGGQSGGAGGAASQDNIEHGAGGSLQSVNLHGKKLEKLDLFSLHLVISKKKYF